VEIVVDGRSLHLGAAKQRALLAVLLLHANEVVPADRLIDALWDERPPESARTALRVYVSDLRKLVGRQRVITRSPGYLLRVEADEVDAMQFEGLVRAALAGTEPSRRAALLRDALALWRGEAFADLAYDAFALGEIRRLEERRLAALEERIEAELTLGQHAELVGELELLVEQHPLRERLRGLLMLALYRSGRQAEALETFRDAGRRLVAEHGVQPGPALRRLQREILTQDASLSPPIAVPSRPSRAEEPAEDEKRLITVLVTSVGASGGSHADTDELGDALNDAVRATTDAIAAHGGEVGSAVDNEVMGFFGASRAQEDDPERAVFAALAIREAVTALGLDSTAAVSTGELLIGRRGGVLAVQGPSLERGHDLKLAAGPGRILIGEETYRLVHGSFEFERAPLRVGGRGSESTAYEVRAALVLAQKARGIEGLRAELQGRERELAHLRATLGHVLDGCGRLVVIVGDAGIGKSRLVSELKDAASTRATWFEGRCRASGAGTSYLPYREIVQRALDWRPGESDAAREQRIVAALDALVAGGHLAAERRDEMVPVLGNLLLVRLSQRRARAVQGITPEQLRNQTLTAVRDVLVALARARPLVVVLEDLHWADRLSLDLTALLMESIQSVPMLLVCIARPEPQHTWRRLVELAAAKVQTAFVEIRLDELSREQSRDMLHTLIPGRDLPTRLEQLILDASQGNPFYLEEVLRSAIDVGALTRGDRSWRAADAPDRLTVPGSVRHVILARVDQLEPGQRRVLQLASVLGRSFARGVLERLVRPDDDFEDAVWELRRRGFLAPEYAQPEEGYSFKHVLTQEAVYSGIAGRRRRLLHQRAAEAIERSYADGLEEHYEQLAYHCERGTEIEKAAEYLFRAGDKARRAYLNDEAVDYLRRALAQLDRLPAETVRDEWLRELAADIHESLGDVLAHTGRHEEATAAYALSIARAPSTDVLRQARLHRKTGEAHQLLRRVDESLAAFDRADESLGDDPAGLGKEWWQERADIALTRGMLLYFWAPVHELEQHVREARALIEAHGSDLQRSRILEREALVAIRRDRYVTTDASLGLIGAALAAAEESGSLSEIVSARFGLGFFLLWYGDLERAEQRIAAALELAERTGDGVHRSRCLAYLALIHRKRLDPESTGRFAAETIAVSKATGMLEYVAHARANLAWVAWRSEDLATARDHAEAAWAGWGFGQFSVAAWMPLWPLIGVAAREGRLPEAVQHLRLLLEPDRQPLPPSLAEIAASVLAAAERDDWDLARARLEHAAEAAAPFGYL
jgi:DNA-binding SARP family transcriptional activator